MKHARQKLLPIAALLCLWLLPATRTQAASLAWADQSRLKIMTPTPGARCTLLVIPTPAELQADAIRLLWAGDGSLRVRSLSTDAPEEEQYDPATKRGASGDARSGVVTTSSRREATLPFEVTILSGSAFSIAAFANGPDFVHTESMERLPTITINGGDVIPFRPDPYQVHITPERDVTRFSIRGLGFSRLSTLVPILHGQHGPPAAFSVVGDTLVTTLLPTMMARDVSAFIFSQPTRAPVIFDVEPNQAMFCEFLPYQVLLRTSPAFDDALLRMIGGAARIEPLEPQGLGRRRQKLPRGHENLSEYRIVTMSPGSALGPTLAALRSIPGIERADLIGTGLTIFSDPNDLLWNEQWNLHQVAGSFCGGFIMPSPNSSINMPSAWQYPELPHVIKIGIIDTGWGYLNEDTSQWNPLVEGVSYAPGDPDPTDTDYQSHGTAVASIAAGRTHNSFGLASPMRVAPPIEPPWTTGVPVTLKCIGQQGGGFPSITQCLIHAANDSTHSIRVVNLSVGGDNLAPSERGPLVRACKNAFLEGILLVAAAGNDKDSLRTYPAGFDDFVLAVGATLWNNLYWTDWNATPFAQPSDSLKGSNWGSWVDLVAPGGRGIAAAKNSPPNGVNPYAPYYTLQNPDPVNRCMPAFVETMGFGGTSASAPLVAGVAAWLLQVRPELTAEDVGQVLMRSATDMGAPGFDVRFGNGRVDAASALLSVMPPYWITHRVVGFGGESPLVTTEAVPTMIELLNADGFTSGMHSCVRYRLAGTVNWNSGFVDVPSAWVRRAETDGIANTTTWNDDERAPWANISAVTAAGAEVETFVYEITDGVGGWYPVRPEEARVALTAIGPSGTLAVDNGPAPKKFGMRCAGGMASPNVRIALSGLVRGPLRVEIFDIAGRRQATLWNSFSVQEARELIWAGVGSDGSVAPSGVYICRASQPGVEVASRVLWIR